MNFLLLRSFGLSRVILFDKQHSALMNQQQSHSHHVTQSGIAYNLQNLACNCNPSPDNEKTLFSLFNWCKNPPSLSVQKPLNAMKFQSQLNIPSSFWHKSLMYCEIQIKLADTCRFPPPDMIVDHIPWLEFVMVAPHRAKHPFGVFAQSFRVSGRLQIAYQVLKAHWRRRLLRVPQCDCGGPGNGRG